jgi:hypothetical protein
LSFVPSKRNYSDAAAIPKTGAVQAHSPYHRVILLFSPEAYREELPAIRTAWNIHRSWLATIFLRRRHAAPITFDIDTRIFDVE